VRPAEAGGARGPPDPFRSREPDLPVGAEVRVTGVGIAHRPRLHVHVVGADDRAVELRLRDHRRVRWRGGGRRAGSGHEKDCREQRQRRQPADRSEASHRVPPAKTKRVHARGERPPPALRRRMRDEPGISHGHSDHSEGGARLQGKVADSRGGADRPGPKTPPRWNEREPRPETTTGVARTGRPAAVALVDRANSGAAARGRIPRRSNHTRGGSRSRPSPIEPHLRRIPVPSGAGRPTLAAAPDLVNRG